ncbi:hypothetical protein HZA57_03935 [Candidatus Poribacteria bacterium]|nr:hypothetical protein [Candidatus Poribacteria bacterium]
MLLWSSQFLVFSLLVLYRFSAAGTQSAHDPVFWIAAAGLFISGCRLTRLVNLYRRIRDRGWNLTLTDFARSGIRPGDVPFIPERAEWGLLPAHQSGLPDRENLLEAIQISRGWDRETRESRRMVPVYRSNQREILALLGDMLAEEGIPSEIDDADAGGLFRVEWGLTLLAPRSDSGRAREIIAEYTAAEGRA